MTIYEQARAFRKDLLAGELEAQGRLYAAYADSYRSSLDEIKSLTDQIAAKQAAGKRVPKTWLREQNRLQRLTEGMARASADFSPKAAGIVTLSQQRSLIKAAQHAKALAQLGRQGEGFTKEGRALTHIVGFLADGSPLTAALEKHGKTAARKASKVLKNGIAKGHDAKRIAKDLRGVAGIPAVKAATIARTETMRAYNAASIETYRANADAFDGYVRIETLDSRTCALCWALHGAIYPLDQDLDTHVNCRGTTLPKRIGKDPNVEPGPERFARLSPERQSEILGPKTFALYQDGQIDLGAVVKRVNDPVWGPTIERRTLAELPSLRSSGGTPSDGPFPYPEGTTPDPRLPKIVEGRRYLDSGPETTVETFSEVVRDAEREVMGVFGKDGRIAYAPIVGERDRVDLSGIKPSLTRGKTVVHNHPESGVMSRPDVQASAYLDVAELRVVLRDGGHQKIRRPKGGWPSIVEIGKAYTEGRDAATEYADFLGGSALRELQTRTVNEAFRRAFGQDAPQIEESP